MVSSPKRRATYEDLLQVPDHLIGEIIDGELVTQPRPTAPHTRAASRLGIEVGGPFDRGRGGPGGWVQLFEPELHLHGDVLVPDFAGWRRERMPEVPDTAAFELSCARQRTRAGRALRRDRARFECALGALRKNGAWST